MATSDSKIIIAQEVLPFVRVYQDGSIERLLGTETTPPTRVSSKDVVLSPETGISARIYLPEPPRGKLPLVVYYHGGAFLTSSPSDPAYHHMLNLQVQEAQVLLISVDYRRAPENPLPTAHDDSWKALKWVAEHASVRDGPDTWINEYADFDRVFLAGDSAGANIAHHMAIRAGLESPGLRISGMLLVHPYFWGAESIGSESEADNTVLKSMVDGWWQFVCPSDKGCDDPLINPFVDEAPSLAGLGCDRALICVAGKDILRERGRLYFRAVLMTDWPGEAEIYETEGEDHVFHLMDPNTENSKILFKICADFINSV